MVGNTAPKSPKGAFKSTLSKNELTKLILKLLLNHWSISKSFSFGEGFRKRLHFSLLLRRIMKPFQTLLFYKYTRINNAEEFAQQHLAAVSRQVTAGGSLPMLSDLLVFGFTQLDHQPVLARLPVLFHEMHFAPSRSSWITVGFQPEK